MLLGGKRSYGYDNLIVTQSSRGSHIVKELEKIRFESMSKIKNHQLNENGKVISQEVYVDPAEKEKHSVSVLCS
jgi:hypothetical protein